MKIKKYIVILLLLCFCLSGCTSKDSPKDISKATDIELDYFEEIIFEVIIKFEKGDYLTDEDEIDWEKELEDTEKIDKEIDNIVIDLSSLNIASEEINEFSTYTNNSLVAVAGENYLELLNQLTSLYSLIPKYMEKYNEDINKVNNKRLKSTILNSFNLSKREDWAGAINETLNAENKYNEMISNSDYINQNSYTINKKYILLQEYKAAINSNNPNLVNINFIRIASEL